LDKHLDPFLKKGRYEIAANVMLYESKIGLAREYFEKALRLAKPGSQRQRNLTTVLSNLEAVSKIARRTWKLSGKTPTEEKKETFNQPTGRTINPSESVFAKILVAIDGSKHAANASKMAIRLAKRDGAELIVVSVVSKPPSYLFAPLPGDAPLSMPVGNYFDYARKSAEKCVNETVSLAKVRGTLVRGRVLKEGSSVVKSITAFAREQEVDLIVMGTRGLGGFDRLLLGSVSGGVVTHANCSVMVVR
jgi:nucleotide-binding universal stress UspA family protein